MPSLNLDLSEVRYLLSLVEFEIDDKTMTIEDSRKAGNLRDKMRNYLVALPQA
jgi:hypothetical protein